MHPLYEGFFLHRSDPGLQRKQMNEKREPRLVLTIEGRTIPINRFVGDIIEGALRGILSSLKKVDAGGEIRLTIRRKNS